MNFDPQDPYPLIPQYTYAQAKAHAGLADQWLGFKCQEIENKIFTASRRKAAEKEQELWIGLDVQSLQTTYLEFRTMLQALPLKAEDLVVDLGCAYARLAHVMKAHYPQCRYLGYEIVPERVIEAQRVLETSFPQSIQLLDLNSQPPVSAEYYFLYDYGSNSAISKTLADLKEISKSKKIQVVARGRASRFLIHRDHPWLSEVQDPQHFETFSIYRS